DRRRPRRRRRAGLRGRAGALRAAAGGRVRITWETPLRSLGGKRAKDVEKETGLATVGDLLGHYPRTYVDKGRLSELDDLVEGDLISLVGQVVSSELKTYQDKRTHRTAYRVLLQVKGEGGTLAMTFFAK